QAADQQVFFYAGNRSIDVFGADRALAQRQAQAGAQLVDIEFNPRSIALDHRRHDEFGPLIGGETPVACRTPPTAAYGVALFRYPGVYDLGIETAAEWAFHGLVLTIDWQTRSQFIYTLAHIG